MNIEIVSVQVTAGHDSRSMLFDTGSNKLTSFTSSPALRAHVGFLTKLQENGALVMQVNIIY